MIVSVVTLIAVGTQNVKYIQLDMNSISILGMCAFSGLIADIKYSEFCLLVKREPLKNSDFRIYGTFIYF